MGEIKSVKVDNWGVFFLQKLQNFFNKTDYCDLTLQFRDNSQLKVHRLVLSACTDYFNVLEQNCDMVDDALIMPNELQADVVVPIVNFMYTGTLEFELKMYGRLLRTAKEMNMTVLLKLLEAHRRTMEGVNKAHRPPSPKAIRRRGPVSNAGSAMSQQLQQQRRVLTTNNGPQQRRGAQVTNTINQQGQQIRQQIGSTAVTRTTVVKQEARDFESHGQQNATSPFEQLRRGYKNNKRPTSTTIISPPAKKPNIEDVKEFAEQQRMRKQIAAEYGEDLEYEGVLDDDIHDDDDDDEAAGPSAEQKNHSLSDSYSSSPVKQRQQQAQAQQSQQQVHEQATITIKQGVGDEPATIIVKEASNTKMNHTKIISEVLRQYPHLVKGSKNIKLKIMPSTAGQPQKIIVKKEATTKPAHVAATTAAAQRVTHTQHQKAQTSHVKQLQSKNAEEKPQSNNEQAATSIQKRRIDSKTMHALIAMGAENTTGPWLCLRCGVNGRPISIPSYRSFRRHLVNTHKELIDQALCEHCGWRSNSNRELHFHTEQEHKIKSSDYAFPECLICAEAYIDSNALNEHMEDNHVDEQKQQCIYCNKIFVKELQLYQHMKSYHKKQAIEDGIIDYEDEEYLEEALTQKEKEKSAAKVKILSDISLPGAAVKMETSSSEADALSAVASGIATSIGVDSETADAEFIQAVTDDNGVETKFINADGNEMVLTAEQRKEIMSQLNQENVGGTVMVLQDDEGAVAAAAEAAKLEQSAQSMEEEYDDSQIYNELASSTVLMQDTQAEETAKQEQESIDWTQSLMSAHEMEEQTEKPKVEKDDLSQKLKELTGDWTDEEDDVDDSFEHNAEQAHEETAVLPKLEKEDESKTVEAEAEAVAEAASCSSEVDDIDMTLKGLHEENPAKESPELEGANDEFSTHDVAAEQKSAADEEELVEKEEKPLEQDVEPEAIKYENAKEENLSEAIDDEKAGSTLLDELIAEADVSEKSKTAIKTETDDDNDEEEEVETAKEITEEDIVETADVAENKELNQETTADDVSMKELQSPTPDAKRAEETVKSLISAWDDDDDDEDETNENEVSKMDVDVEKSEISNVINKQIDEDENALSNKDDTDL